MPRRRRLRVFTPSGAGRRALDSVVHIQLIRLIIVVDDSTPHTHARTQAHDGLSRRGRRIPMSSVRLAMLANRQMREAHGLPETSQVHIIVPLASTGSFLAFHLATRAAVRLSSKADMAFEQHCLQTHLSRGAVRNTEGARSHARKLILRLSL